MVFTVQWDFFKMEFNRTKSTENPSHIQNSVDKIYYKYFAYFVEESKLYAIKIERKKLIYFCPSLEFVVCVKCVNSMPF